MMKRFYQTWGKLFILTLAISPLYGLSFGIKGGMNISTISVDDIGSPESLTGFMVGGYATANISRSFAIQSEVLYSQKGWMEAVDYSGVRYTTTARLNYLEVPFILSCTFGTRVQPTLYSGPSFAAMVSTTANVSHGVTITSGNIDAIINNTDIGWVFGAGVRTPIKVSFDVRYTMSLSSIDASGLNLDVKNRNISFIVGYEVF